MDTRGPEGPRQMNINERFANMNLVMALKIYQSIMPHFCNHSICTHHPK